MARERTGTCRYERGAWRIQTYIGRDPGTGKKRYRTATIHAPHTAAGEKVARKALAHLLLEVNAGLHQPVARGTLAELLDSWVTTRTPDWPAGTATHIRQVLDRHVIPDLGRRRLDDLTPELIDRLYGRLRSDGLAPATVRKIHSYLHAALAQAVRWRLIPTNPATPTNRPPVPKRPPRNLPDAAHLRRAITKANPWLAIAIRLAIHTGARRGEIARLRWTDITDRPTDSIITFHQTKTDTYKRVPVGAATTRALRDWHQTVREQAMAVGRPDLADLWVFPTWKGRVGGHMRPDAFTQAWIRLRASHHLGDVRLHDLRHLMATQLIGTGHDVRTVANRGGWASPGVLLDTYAQPVDAAELRAAQAMDDWLDGTGT